jgi:hypothetical protein
VARRRQTNCTATVRFREKRAECEAFPPFMALALHTPLLQLLPVWQHRHQGRWQNVSGRVRLAVFIRAPLDLVKTLRASKNLLLIAAPKR